MTIEVPDNCECTDIEVCNRCRWETACTIEELAQNFNKVCKYED